jgi:hypothetical protein
MTTTGMPEAEPRPKRRFQFRWMLVLLLLAGGIWLVFRQPEPEPSHDGKPLQVWLKGFDANQGSAEYAAAENAIQQMGTNALPALINYLRRKDPPFYRHWIHLKAKLHLLRGGVDYAFTWHRRAAYACGALGVAGAPAFRAMTEAMNDPYAAHDVGNALSRMMPASVPVLTNILATGNVLARSRAADNLVTAYSHPEVEPMARTALLAALRDSEPGVRMSVVSAFAFWNVQRDVIVVELAQALRDPHPSVRGNAVSVLGNFGSAARPAVPEVLKLLSDNASYVRGTVADRALQVLRRIDPEAAAQAGVK